MELTAKKLEEAILFATIKHQDQTRKGDGRPYILHPLSVLHTLSSIKKSKNHFLLAIAAVLHDVVEDCNVSVEEISKEFGHNVASIVEELTSDKEAIKEKGKQEYLLEKMLNISSYSLCIKLCDRLDNMRDMDSMNAEFKEKSISQTEFILNGLTERKLSKTHKKIIKLIRKVIEKQKKKMKIEII